MSTPREKQLLKKMIIVTRPEKLDAVKQALARLGLGGLTMSQAMGYGRQCGQKTVYRGTELDPSLLPKVKVETAIPADRIDEIVDIVRAAVATGGVGDGKIIIVPLDDVVRIRTGESGPDAF